MTTRKKSRVALPPKRSKFPVHLGTSAEQWRALKRTEWRAVMAALDKFRFGGAYVPDQRRFSDLYREAERYEVEIEADGWVAW